jgi:predicted nucleotidyltransferase
MKALILLDYPARSAAWFERALPFARERGIVEHVVKGIAGEAERTGLWDELRAIARPVLLVKGGRSPAVSYEDFHRYRETPGVRVEVFTESGHEIHQPDYERFIGTIEGFLAELDRVSALACASEGYPGMPKIEDRHHQLLDRLLPDLEREPFVIGVMLQGSVARGDHQPGSDLDLLVLVADGQGKGLVSEQIDGILVERHYRDEATLRQRFERRPDLAYGLVDGRILHDPRGRLAALTSHARRLLVDYQTPESVREDIYYWLYASRVKLVAAWDAGDELKAAFLVASTTWKILEGIWAVNDLPIPHSGAVLAHLSELADRPDDFGGHLNNLLLGDIDLRVTASLVVIDWVLNRLQDED